MAKLNIGVIRGGVGPEYDVSLQTGGAVLRALPIEKYIPHDILITKDGVWHMNGFPVTMDKIARNLDVVFNGLHGPYGEDGGLQRDLEQFGMKYTGSSVFPSALAMNKLFAKEYFKKAGIKTPRGAVVRSDEDIDKAAVRIFQKIPAPYVVKPAASGSSVGVSVARAFEELTLAIAKAFEHSSSALVEEYIPGREVTCGVVDSAHGGAYALQPAEVMLSGGNEIFDYTGKYNGSTEEMCPARLSDMKRNEVQELAKKAHEVLGMRHYSRSDFIISPRGIYLLEVNSLPGLTEASLLPKELVASGVSMPEFVDHVITLALIKK